MRFVAISLTALLLAGTVFAELPDKPGIKKSPLSKKPPLGCLTDKELSELLTNWQCPKTEKKITFQAHVARQYLCPKKDKSALGKYKRSGKVPFRVTADMIEAKKSGRKMIPQRLSGTVRIYVLDSEGKLVLKKTSSLAKLCPT